MCRQFKYLMQRQMFLFGASSAYAYVGRVARTEMGVGRIHQGELTEEIKFCFICLWCV